MKSLPKVLRSGIIQPKYVLAVVVVLMVMMVGMGLYEFSSGKQDIMRVLREEAMSLAEAVSIMSDNSLVSSYKIEDIMFSRLLDNARIIEHIDNDGRLSEELLKEIIEQSQTQPSE